MKKALVILSGGQDSTTCLFWAKERYAEVHAITFDYGQRHRREIESAKTVAMLAGVTSHRIVNVEGLLVSSSPLTSKAELEQYESFEQMDEIIGTRVEKTFVPMRNTLFLTIAANHALSLGINRLVTGVCQEDNANYPDCTQRFIESIERTFMQSLASEFYIETPLMFLSKAETVKLAHSMPECWAALAYTHTSYDGQYPPTDNNHANVLRAHGFMEAGLPDPLVVRAWREGFMQLPETSNYDEVRSA